MEKRYLLILATVDGAGGVYQVFFEALGQPTWTRIGLFFRLETAGLRLRVLCFAPIS